MSGHADTIREVFSLLPKAAVEIDSLLDENQRYEKALRYYASRVTWQHGGPTDGEIARRALAGEDG